jgi:uncharacterized protein (TIGR00251 family)
VIPPTFLREQDGAEMLTLKVQPRASRNEIAGPLGQGLKLKVMAPPVDSAANEAVLGFVTKHLVLPRRAVILVRGQTSPHKTIRLDGISLADAARKLA